jgi:NADH dehydrogenase
MILVAGATGVLGSATTKQLLAQGHTVRAMTRTPAKAAELGRLGAEIVQGDLREPDSLRRACEGAEKVLATAHSLMGRGREASKYVDDAGHKQLIDIAQAAGVQHFVYTSANGVSPDHPTRFGRIKYDVEQYLQRSGLNYTILRPTAFMEWHAHTFIGQPILEQGQVTLLGRGENPRNFVAGDDVARFAVIALTDPQASGQIIDIGGPENWSNMEVVALYEALAGHKAKVKHIPRGMLRVMSVLLRPFHPGLSQVMAFSLWTDTGDMTFDPSETLKRYPMKLTRLESWVQAQAQGRVVSPTGLAGV